MKIGVLQISPTISGGTTEAVQTVEELRRQGHTAEIITFSKSGKKLAWMNPYVEMTVLKRGGVASYLNKFELLYLPAMGSMYDKGAEELPWYYHDLLDIRKDMPLVVGLLNPNDLKMYPYWETLQFVGRGIRKCFARPPTLKVCREKQLLPQWFDEICQPVPLRISLDRPLNREEYHEKASVCVTCSRISSDKGVDKAAEAWADVKYDIPLFLNGPITNNRIKIAFEAMPNWNENVFYFGEFKHVKNVLEHAMYFIDLTNRREKDGGVQYTGLEAANYFAIPILMKGWEFGECGVVEKRNKLKIAEALNHTFERFADEEERYQAALSNYKFVRKHHNAKTVTEAMVEEFRGVLNE